MDAWPETQPQSPTNGGLPDSTLLAQRIRRHAVRMTSSGGSSHVGSVLSMADIVAVLYAGILRVDGRTHRGPGGTDSY